MFLCARGQEPAPAHTSTPDTTLAGAFGALRIASGAAATNSSSGDGSGDGGVRAGALDVGDVGSSGAGARVGLELLNVRSRVSRPPPTDVVHITTSDGEWFPVKKALLRPCVALTKVGTVWEVWRREGQGFRSLIPHRLFKMSKASPGFGQCNVLDDCCCRRCRSPWLCRRYGTAATRRPV